MGTADDLFTAGQGGTLQQITYVGWMHGRVG